MAMLIGHTNSRKGEDRAVMRILSRMSTLVILVFLMEDQLTGVPYILRAHCLHTNQTPQ
ncbi:ATP-dependent DNA helicase Q4-like [Musca autumnalis]|uniref:ATP-dependent DNA helicase Q4-like n=1 Tax=Musca autumnalis TaxID=221902 RepID=UPI003CEC56E2